MRLGLQELLCWCLILLAGTAYANEAGFCLQGAQNLPPNDAQLSKGERSMPPARPVLAAFDWDPSSPANEQQATTAYTPCHAEAPIFRYKVVKDVVYVDHDHHNDHRYKAYRMAFLEQLVLAMWLYRDFPSVDLVVDFTDHPQLCDQDIPFLRYSIFNLSQLPAAQAYNLTELLAPAWVTQAYAARVKTYTRGFTMPNPEAWRDLSLTAAQLADFTSCLDRTHPWATKQLKAFWRGQATGCSRGWPRQTTAISSQAAAISPPQPPPQAQPHLLRNKRVQMVLRLFPYQPQLADVGISSLPQLTPECLGLGPGEARRRRRQQPRGDRQSSQPRHRRRHRPVHMRPRRRLVVQDTWDEPAAGQRKLANTVTGLQHAVATRWLKGWRSSRRKQPAQPAGQAGLADPAADEATAVAEPGAATTVQTGTAGAPGARPYRGVATLLHKEGIGLEGWADAALTLSIDGYGPPFRLPQQALLGSAVLRMTSPYQSWLDWELLPGRHLQEFAYDLTDLEQLVMQQLTSVGKRGSISGTTKGNPEAVLQGMARAAKTLVASKVELVAQLEAFAWSVARYKQACHWEVQVPPPGHATWRVLQLGADVFQSKGVPENVRLQVMQHVNGTFQQALQHPAMQAALQGV